MSGAKVKPLEWEMFWKQDEGRRETAKTVLGETYHVSSEGWWFPLWNLNECDGIDAAKAAAQADYEARILSALEPQQEEAVAWVPVNPQTRQYSLSEAVSHFRQDWADDLKADGWIVCPLYAHPTPVQKVQESQTVSVTDEMVRKAGFELAAVQGLMIIDEVDQRMFEEDARKILTAALEPSPALHSIRED